MKSFGTSGREGHDSSHFYSRKLYDSDTKSTEKSHINGKAAAKILKDKSLNRIYNHTGESMHELPDNSVHLMVTSPPYNVGKDYDDDLTMDEYTLLLNNVWKETYRVLVPGGRACINIANVGRKPYIPINTMIIQNMLDMGYLMRGEIIWNKSASAGTSCAWGSWKSPSNPVLRDTHEYIMIFCKDDFSRKVKDGEPTIERDEFLEFTKSVWDFGAESAKRVGHPAPFPIELPRRLIQLYTYSNDVVLDPFMGSGSTALAALKTKRRWVGYDTSRKYVKLAKKRIEAYLQNESLLG